ncbi:MAG TPA: sulfite exporter TauE/SafE family protein [Geminicoccus sp.]|uniref:sulfite exporter TauE/SafE family protein n=1 Tax=Geminicoccus sp. TaxID=2024832 RepID=UPI002BD8660B|nr:sulfite exporter TauE/SafE family protein [Geminicoccus sp.]HWL70568.1 sulfite exporter TauE/SafE family protein [Geminicoccus sp.]
MDVDILMFVAIGFLAQMVDGALGMAFGVICSSSLIAFGLPPVMASASVHAAEIVTTGISGGSHVWHRNVDKRLFLRLAVTGVAGGVVGAYLLTGLPTDIVKAFVAFYLVGMALLIIDRVRGRVHEGVKPPPQVLGAGGGFLDAIGGGGWGPIVASSLMATGGEPRRSIGSANCAEFFVTVAVSVTFMLHLELAEYSRIVLGLVIGGALAAPLAGWLIRIMPQKLALGLVAIVVSAQAVISLYSFMRA